jgi:hypothetical protein
MLRQLSVLTTCVLCQAATAGTIYKCLESGRMHYTDQPCPGAGSELAIPTAPAPDPEASARLQRNRATLLELEKLRVARELREERDAVRARREAAALRKRCDRLRLQHKWAEEDQRRSSGAAAETAGIKARRQREALAVECPA